MRARDAVEQAPRPTKGVELARRQNGERGRGKADAHIPNFSKKGDILLNSLFYILIIIIPRKFIQKTRIGNIYFHRICHIRFIGLNHMQ